MKKLLYVVNVDWFFQSHRLPIAVQAQRAGYEVHIATTVTDRREALEACGLQVHDLPLERGSANVVRELRTFVRLWRLLRTLRPELVHLVTVKPVVLGGIAARLARVPAVVSAISGLGFVFLASGLRAKLLRTAVLALYRIALGHPRQRVVFQNAGDRELLERYAGLDRARSVIVRGSGVDLAHFAQQPFPAEPPVVVLFAARLLRDKGLLEFVEAARRLKREGRPAVFRLAGSPDPDNRSSVQASEVEAWRSEGCVEPLGQQADMRRVLAESHIVVLPSYREGLPKVLAEAAAVGRPVITTDVPGCRDAIEVGATGLLVPPRDPAALADAIRRLIERPGERVAMGAAGRRLAEREFAVDGIVRQHLDLYRLLVPAP